MDAWARGVLPGVRAGRRGAFAAATIVSDGSEVKMCWRNLRTGKSLWVEGLWPRPEASAASDVSTTRSVKGVLGRWFVKLHRRSLIEIWVVTIP